MTCTLWYASPLGRMLLAAEDDRLVGAWFEGQRFFPEDCGVSLPGGSLPVLDAACAWLDAYFSGKEPGVPPPLRFSSTPFRMAVWRTLLRIPYGKTVTYGQIAAEMTEQGRGRMSARAVGGAVGRNPLAVFVPCHRVVGAGGRLTGYAAGLAKKSFLLELEKKGAGNRSQQKG